MRGIHARCALVPIAIAWLAVPLGAQELDLKRDLPPTPTEAPCLTVGVDVSVNTAEAMSEDGSQATDRSGELLADASRATVLGELSRARTLLVEARDLNPTVAEIHFQLARVNASLGEPAGAVEAFCHVVILDPDGEDAEEALAGIDRLSPDLPDPIPSDARSAFEEGVSRFDADDPSSAADAFSRALQGLPDWPEAQFNRGLALMAAGDQDGGQTAFASYLSLRPDSPDRAEVAALLRESGPSEPRHHPGVALAAGAIVPGGGQLYTGKHGTGLVYLVAAAASMGFGALHVRTRIECRSIPGPEGCLPDDVLDRTRSRPFLTPGVAAGATIAWIAAVRAFQHASSGNADGVAASTLGSAFLTMTPLVDSNGVGFQATVGVDF